MGNLTIMEYTDKPRKYLACCTNVLTAETKFIFKTNMADWLASYILPYNCPDLPEMLCTEQIGSMQHI